jgi:hypothetical protein
VGGPAHPALIPAAVKWALAIWLAAWLPLHLLFHPAHSLLWMCAYGNLIVVLGLCREDRLLVSWQSVSLLVPQTLYAAEALARLATGMRGGGTSYLFDAALPLAVRALSAFHFVMPAVLLWGVARLGYDRRALPLQWVTALLVSLASLAVGPINLWCVQWARDHVLWALVIGPPLLHVPAHFLLRTLDRSRR